MPTLFAKKKFEKQRHEKSARETSTCVERPVHPFNFHPHWESFLHKVMLELLAHAGKKEDFLFIQTLTIPSAITCTVDQNKE